MLHCICSLDCSHTHLQGNNRLWKDPWSVVWMNICIRRRYKTKTTLISFSSLAKIIRMTRSRYYCSATICMQILSVSSPSSSRSLVHFESIYRRMTSHLSQQQHCPGGPFRSTACMFSATCLYGVHQSCTAQKQFHDCGPSWGCAQKARDSFIFVCTRHWKTLLRRASEYFTDCIPLLSRSHLWLAN